MKILIVTGCVYAKNCGRSSFTGLDYVVSEIATKLGETNDVTVYTITSYPSSSRLENVTIRSYSVKKNNSLY